MKIVPDEVEKGSKSSQVISFPTSAEPTQSPPTISSCTTRQQRNPIHYVKAAGTEQEAPS
ncbi:hypothetical protein Dda_0219 [Drechslerella dactyloides]|uniref:Uncharacterized protein n=1 Tax=Drechslerella dactyloides TaxID=74499 RepID=A0AAD6J444_DREDA|nr:hypothetical protein Dda_0219 [Drechslerella dactyloides]